jgi:1-acyl-sn-glycerol-3-phosphate acyltransferase
VDVNMNETMSRSAYFVKKLASKMLQKAEFQRLDEMFFLDAGHGYDAFGLHPEFIRLGAGLTRWPYESYFRVISKGSEHIPEYGAAILAANHSGNLPIDGMMLWHDVIRNTNPPRVARGIADHFVPSLPFIGTLFARGGMVGGSRGNVRTLLENGELLMIFPEGTPGIIKPFSKRYQLQKFRVGHAELAVRNQVPIIPIGIVGAEEQLPSMFSSRRLGRMFGIESVPIPLILIPLPVRYRIFYGKPITDHLSLQPLDADDPEIVSDLAKKVQNCVDELIQKGLRERPGVFV